MKHTTTSKHQHYYQQLNARFAAVPAVKLFYVSLALLALAVCTLGGALLVQHNTQRPATPAAGFAVGRKVTSGLATSRVISIKTIEGEGALKAPEGQEYVVVTLEVRNNSSDTINILPSTDTYLKDSLGNVAYLSPYSLDTPFRAGGLAAGDVVRGQLSYLAHKTASLKFYIDGIWSGGVVPFKVQ